MIDSHKMAIRFTQINQLGFHKNVYTVGFLEFNPGGNTVYAILSAHCLVMKKDKVTYCMVSLRAFMNKSLAAEVDKIRYNSYVN